VVTPGTANVVFGTDSKERLAMNVQKLLQQHHVAFRLLDHEPTYAAQRLAQVVHVSGGEVAKVVLLRADDGYVLAVLPATRSVNVDRVRELVGAASVKLATESECGKCFPDCELGALPPFGSKYGMRTLVDRSLSEDDEIVFEGNTHHQAIRLKFRDYAELEKPRLADFSHPFHRQVVPA
jgi:Ala-tRNA(Pro) deacylase